MTGRSRVYAAARAAKLVGAYVAPNGYYIARDRLRARRGRRRREEASRVSERSLAATRAAAFSYEDAIRFLVRRGLDAREVRAGSMPEASLGFAVDRALEELASGRPLVGLQVGNFVGVSLAYVSARLIDAHPDSVMVSVDPNIKHRGISNPAGHVLALLGRFGLLANNVVITGYSLEQSLGDDPELEPLEHKLREQACERVIDNLAAVGGRRFDLALIDGNHSGEYLARELTALRRLLRPGAVLIVDDVVPGTWSDVVEVFEAATPQEDHFEELGRDGRVGVVQLKTGSPAPTSP